MAAKDAKAVRELITALVQHRRNLIVSWFKTGPAEEKLWGEFTRLQSIIEALRKLEKEEKL